MRLLGGHETPKKRSKQNVSYLTKYTTVLNGGLFRFGVLYIKARLTICPADGPVLTKEGPENSTFDPLRNDTLLLKLLLLKLF